MRLSVGDLGQDPDDKAGPERRRDAFFDGIWWPVGHESLKAEGTASAFADGHVWLDIEADAWNVVRPRGDDSTPSVPTVILHGRSSLGAPMTLLGVQFVGGQKDGLSGRGHVRYVADRLIVGVEAEREEDVHLTSVQVSFGGLREWLVGNIGDPEGPLELRVSDGDSDTAEEWLRTAALDCNGVQVGAYVRHSLSRSTRFHAEFETRASIQLDAPEPLSLATWRREWIEPLRDLVLFGTRQPTVTLRLSGQSRPPAELDVRVYSAPEVSVQTAHRARHVQGSLLPAGIWGPDGFADLIDEWRSLHLELGGTARALFEIVNSVDVQPFTRLLRLTTCAEGYHRVKHDNPTISDDQHATFLDAMLQAIPDEAGIREHYKRRLQHANGQSQRQRIRWLVKRASEHDKRLRDYREKLTGRLVDWRNDNTHLGDAVQEPDEPTLALLGAMLEYVLDANILIDLGVEEDVGPCLAQSRVWDDPVPAFIESLSR